MEGLAIRLMALDISLNLEADMKTILIIDDDEMVRKSFKAILEREGYEVKEWPGSTYADKAIEKINPDIVLTDHNFKPEEELGFCLALRLKRKGVKIILMSGDTDIGIEAVSNGLPFLQKPSMVQTLLNIIKEVGHD